jgi:hypothetical protein
VGSFPVACPSRPLATLLGHPPFHRTHREDEAPNTRHMTDKNPVKNEQGWRWTFRAVLRWWAFGRTGWRARSSARLDPGSILPGKREKNTSKKVAVATGAPQANCFGSAVLPLPCPGAAFEGMKREKGLVEVFLPYALLESCWQRFGFVSFAWNDRPLFLSRSRVAPAQQLQVGDPNLARLCPETEVEAG